MTITCLSCGERYETVPLDKIYGEPYCPQCKSSHLEVDDEDKPEINAPE